jgi:hypothetical protein
LTTKEFLLIYSISKDETTDGLASNSRESMDIESILSSQQSQGDLSPTSSIASSTLNVPNASLPLVSASEGEKYRR